MKLSTCFVGFLIAAGLMSCGTSESGSSGDWNKLEGVWQVSSHTENLDGCEAEGDTASEPLTYFKLEKKDWVPYIGFASCSSASNCEDVSFLSYWYFDTLTDDGAKGIASASLSSTGEDCNLTINSSEAVLTENAITMTSKNRSGTVAPPSGKQCSDDGVLDQLKSQYADSTSLTCNVLRVVTATKVE